MNRSRPAALVLAAALAASLLPGRAPAAEEEGPRWMRSLKQAIEISKERGYPILVWCSIDGDKDNKADQDVMRSKEVLKAMKGFLVCYGNNETGHGSIAGTLDGKPAKVCSLAPGITCQDHKTMMDIIYSNYGDVCVDASSNMRTPVHFVIDGDGKVVGQLNNGTRTGGFDVVPAPKMVEGLKALLDKAGGPGLTDEQFEQFRKALASARESLDGKRVTEAAKALIPIVATGKKIALVADAKELLARVDKSAAPALAMARSVLKEDPVAGLVALEKVAGDFPGTESGIAARKELDAYRASPEGKKVLQAMGREKEGRAELDRALKEAGDGKDDAKLLRLLDGIAKRYEGVPCAAEAKRQADLVRNDPARMKALEAAAEEREARGDLTAAKGLLDAGKKDEAVAALRRILDKHPGTKAAEEAKKVLEGIR